jgi:Rieske Fe-S protein
MFNKLVTFVGMWIMAPYRFVKGYMDKTVTTVDALAAGQGAVVEIKGQKVAAYKDKDGKLNLHSAICPHLKCVVKWNEGETVFDCPCHGSRFKADGTLVNGPATRGLDEIK